MTTVLFVIGAMIGAVFANYVLNGINPREEDLIQNEPDNKTDSGTSTD